MNNLDKLVLSRRDKMERVASSKTEEDREKEYQFKLAMVTQGVMALASEFKTPVTMGIITKENIQDFLDVVVVASEAQISEDDDLMSKAKKMLRAWNEVNMI